MNEKDIEEMTDDQARKIGDKILKVLNSNFRTPEDDAADHARQTLVVMAAYLNQMASMLGVKDVKPGTDKQATAIITEIDNLKRHAHGLQTQLDTVLALSKTAAFNLGLSRKNAHDWEEAADAARNDLEQVACDLGVGDDIGNGRPTIDVVRDAVKAMTRDLEQCREIAERDGKDYSGLLALLMSVAAELGVFTGITSEETRDAIIAEIHRRERNSDALVDKSIELEAEIKPIALFATRVLTEFMIGADQGNLAKRLDIAFDVVKINKMAVEAREKAEARQQPFDESHLKNLEKERGEIDRLVYDLRQALGIEWEPMQTLADQLRACVDKAKSHALFPITYKEQAPSVLPSGGSSGRVPMSGIERDIEDLKRRVARLERCEPF